MNRASRSLAVALAAALALSLSACDLFGGLVETADSGSAFVRFLEPVDGAVDLRLSSSEAGRKAYAVFTTDYVSGYPVPGASSSSVVRSAMPVAADRNAGVAEAASEARRAEFRSMMENFVQAPSARMATTGDPAADTVDMTKEFTMYGDTATTTMVCRYVSPIPVVFGSRTRTLSIWAPDSVWSDTSSNGKVSDEQVNALVAAFFGEEGVPDESIYAWVTNILGDEWGPEGSIRYGGAVYDTIGETGNITILLADIDGDNDKFITDGGVVGYFYPGDTIPSSNYSNERVMFTIDAVMLGTVEGPSWDITDPWPATVRSTLAHEFQHMIHFYQKGVVAGADLAYESTWIDELCSMQVEDLLSDKLGVTGPRGVNPAITNSGPDDNPLGRLPRYLLYPDISLEGWPTDPSNPFTIYYYSLAYSFGAYLTRNYGGAEIIRSIVHSSDSTAGCVADAAASCSGGSESMVGLLRKWGAAVLLSSRTDAPEYYRYNSGGAFTSSVGGETYSLGSINMYNYLVSSCLDTDGDGVGDKDLTWPYAYSSSSIGSMNGGAYSNAFMYLGDPSADRDWTLTLPAGMHATIVID